MADFSPIATEYQRRASVQQAAGEALLDMLAVASAEDVLDLACGPGALTARLRNLTTGRVTGCDAASGMIAEARRQYGDGGIEFVECDAAALPFAGEFDAVYCNSSFQWFADPTAVLAACLRALRPEGRMAMQCPAKAEFCPGFVRAVEELRQHAETRDTFARYQSPWLFLETAENYDRLFAGAGFEVLESHMETAVSRCPPEQAMEIFHSGSALAYLNPQCYAGGVPPDYPARAAAIVAAALRRQAGTDGLVSLAFNRVYLLARKRGG